MGGIGGDRWEDVFRGDRGGQVGKGVSILKGLEKL